MGSDCVKDLIHDTVTTSQNGWVEVWLLLSFAFAISWFVSAAS